jgi:fructokinase
VAKGEAPRVNVVDTVGAGDTFWGNCLGDWCEGPEEASTRVPETLRWAMQAAAINCTRAGCEPPTWVEVQAR